MLNRLFAALALTTALACAAQQPAAIASDPPQDKAHPAAMDAFTIPSHGVGLNALAYIAAGSGPHPVVVLLHGFPGNEKNLDLAQAMRRAGWDVLFFNYRGSWGTPGSFSFEHCLEDVQSALTYLQTPANAARLRLDSRHIVVIGHSMGGMMAALTGAKSAAVEATGLISAADMAGGSLAAVRAGHSAEATLAMTKGLAAEGMAPLAGCTPQSLAKEAVAHAAVWSIPAAAPGLARHPLLVVSSNDGLAAATDALITRVKAEPGAAPVTALHLETDHAYSDQRIALETAVLQWLATLPQ